MRPPCRPSCADRVEDYAAMNDGMSFIARRKFLNVPNRQGDAQHFSQLGFGGDDFTLRGCAGPVRAEQRARGLTGPSLRWGARRLAEAAEGFSSEQQHGSAVSMTQRRKQPRKHF